MKHRIEENKVYVSLNYDPYFNSELKKKCDAKWCPETKEWAISLENRDRLDKLLLAEYGRSTRPSVRIVIEFNAADFYIQSRGSTETLKIGCLTFAKRYKKDEEVELFGTEIVSGGFPEEASFCGYPAIAPLEGTVLRAVIREDFYKSLKKNVREKIKVIGEHNPSEAYKKSLEARKQELLEELAKIEKELEKAGA